MAGAYRRGLTLNACAPMTRPMYSSTGTSACIGKIARNVPTSPVKQTTATTIPVASEYPTRPPTCFQPGWPMYTAGGNGDPRKDPTTAPRPSAARTCRVE